eukprot:TRINITY_DN113_c0_g1_i2.p1 TRINITY_DN113_c0_g1~~TRINITY_DN113_c0_g1_i2.p1  ORF type:complete len:159 (+),score=12.23 TRINITY_DN113_c0_g1_i2:98-574(+)
MGCLVSVINQHPLHFGFVCLFIQHGVSSWVPLGKQTLADRGQGFDVAPPVSNKSHETFVEHLNVGIQNHHHCTLFEGFYLRSSCDKGDAALCISNCGFSVLDVGSIHARFLFDSHVNHLDNQIDTALSGSSASISLKDGFGAIFLDLSMSLLISKLVS